MVTTNPVGATDNVDEGDNHIRNIKTAVQGSFPNLGAAAVTKLATEINNLLNKTGDTMTGDLKIVTASDPFSAVWSTVASSVGVRMVSGNGASARIDVLDNAGTFDAVALSFSTGGDIDIPVGAFSIGGAGAITDIHDEDTMVSDDANGLATQQSIKKYVDDTVAVSAHGARVNSAGALTTGSTGITSARNATGDYTISHSIGDTNYSVTITTTDNNTVARTNGIGSTGIGVIIDRVDNGAPVDSGFSIAILEW